MIINILMYILMIYLMFRMFGLSKRNKKNQELVRMVNTIEDPDNFFDNCDEYINTIQDTVFENKARIIKMFGMVYHHRYDGFEEVLDDVDIDALFNPKDGTIKENEDSFFYMYLAIPNLLYAAGDDERREMLRRKMEPYAERLRTQLCCAISENCEKYYTGTDDRGEAFYRKVIDGEYGGFSYSKSLIGLYKMICNAMLIKIYGERGDDTEEFKELNLAFAGTGIGKRWMRAIGLEIPVIETETEEDETEPLVEETEAEIDVPKETMETETEPEETENREEE